MTNLTLSIIIVSYNTKDLLKQCVDSIFIETKDTSYEIIVVDNGSSDGSLEIIKSYQVRGTNCQGIKVIANKENVGFGAANNQGAKIAKGEYVLLLNSDCKLVDGTIDKLLLKALASLKNDKIVGCLLLNADNSLQPSAGFFPTLDRVFAQMFFIDDLPFVKNLIKPYQQNDLNFYKRSIDDRKIIAVEWITGAFMLMKRGIFEKVNGFDENIFMYGEEVDLCYRLNKLFQIKCEVFTDIECFHYKGKSSRDGVKAAILGEYKGLKTIYQKHWPSQLGLLKLILFFGALLRILLFGIIAPSKSKIYIQALKKIF